MSKLSPHQTAHRVLHLLFGMRLPRVRAALEPYGFSSKALEEGWELLGALVMGSEAVPGINRQVNKPFRELAAYEDQWFSLIRAVLGHRYPELERLLFAKLHPTRGRESAVTVHHFLERLGQMAQGAAPYGPDGPAARRLLARRGFTKKVETQGRELLAQLRHFAPASDTLAINKDRDQAASDALWAWYLEWSAITRTAVKDRVLLRALGFNPRAGRATRRYTFGRARVRSPSR